MAGLYFFRPAGTLGSVRSSRVLGALIYTQNRQVIAEAAPELYLQGGALRVEGGIRYVRFPDTFYGVGNDTPEEAAEDYTAGTFALEGVAGYKLGAVPFTQMPMLGGQNLLRGLFGGRYRDHALVAAQAELRVPVWRWFGLAAFAGAGEVAHVPR